MICLEQALVDRHFAGTITSRDERSMREHVTACAACRARYRRHLLLASLLPPTEPAEPTEPTTTKREEEGEREEDAEPYDGTATTRTLSAEERIAVGLGLLGSPFDQSSVVGSPRKRTPRPLSSWQSRWILPVASVLAAAAAVLFFLRPLPRGVDEDRHHFTARGSTAAPKAKADGDSDAIKTNPFAAAKPAISVYRITNNDKPTPMLLAVGGAASSSSSSSPSDVVGREDELAFAYQNVDRKTHLMIFGVDEQGRVYWFHPAWSVESDNPSAIPIASDDTGPHELREAIRHQFTGERLEVHGLFLDAPLTVREVESVVRDRHRARESGPITVLKGGVDHVVSTFGVVR